VIGHPAIDLLFLIISVGTASWHLGRGARWNEPRTLIELAFSVAFLSMVAKHLGLIGA
jgi:hypothetical protein